MTKKANVLFFASTSKSTGKTNVEYLSWSREEYPAKSCAYGTTQSWRPIAEERPWHGDRYPVCNGSYRALVVSRAKKAQEMVKSSDDGFLYGGTRVIGPMPMELFT